MVLRKSYLDKIIPFIDQDLIKVLVGIRRCGKTVLLGQIKDCLLYTSNPHTGFSEAVRRFRSRTPPACSMYLLNAVALHGHVPVSYTHLDVYQRQIFRSPLCIFNTVLIEQLLHQQSQRIFPFGFSPVSYTHLGRKVSRIQKPGKICRRERLYDIIFDVVKWSLK